MTPADRTMVIAQYRDAIDELEKYQAREPDAGKRNDASARIADYRSKIIDQAWSNMTSRTDALNKLVDELRAIADNASKIPQLAEAVTKLRETSDKAAELNGGTEIQCKNCNVKVVYLPNALAAIAPTGGKKKITLTCRNLHTNEYEINAP